MSNPKIFLQPELIEGDNIDIAQDGKTISSNTPLANITDTDITEVEDGQVLKYDGTNQKWTNSTGGGGGSNLILDAQRYSLDEQVVGIWTDGKPLYQKSFATTISTINTPVTMADVSGLDIDAIVDVEGCYRRLVQGVNDSIIYEFNTVQSSTISSWLRIVNKSNLQYQITNPTGDNSIITNQWATIQYTKTTDTAGSGGYQAYGFSPIVCSDTEREVGVWEDNKPLYQKTFIGTLGGTTGGDVSNYKMADLSDIDTIASISGTLQGITPINSYYASNNYNMVFVNGAKNGLYCNGKNIGGNTYKVTIQYTKASDTAGSGEYNTLAIPNVHYDGEEKVVGTWYGETMYEKTYISTTAVNAGGYVILDANLTNASHLKVKGITCKASQTSSSEIYPNVYTSTIGGKNIEIAISNSSGLYAENYTSLCIRNLEVTVQYTKTT